LLEQYGNYELVRRLAAGGMAEIFLARQQGLEGFEKELVIKRILPHLASEVGFIRMFLDEARIAARLNHPNIAQIFNLGAQGGTYFIAMEYVEGRDLRGLWKLCEQRGAPMPPNIACWIISQCAAALHHAHKATNRQGKPLGIVHRDVSPQNILVADTGAIKVVDFGIAKAADSSTHTRAGVLKGKFAYMSPELAAGQKIDRRTDVFALGTVLHELLTGKRLFKRDTDVSTLSAVGECRIERPSNVLEDLPEDLDEVVLKSLRRNPKDRYQTAQEFQLALEQWVLEHQLPSGEPAVAQFVDEVAAEAEKRAAAERKSGKTGNSQKGSSPRAEKKEDAQTRMPRSKSAPKPSSRPQTEVAPAPSKEKRPETQVADVKPAARPTNAILAFLLGIAVVGLVGLTVLLLNPSHDAAVMKVSSVPAGAKVFFNGEPLPAPTPCTLPAAGAGSYWLEVSIEGHETYRAKVDIPAHGERELTVVLKPLGK
jgi:eukaryotic-like serine/threonine-protein kinase